MADRNASNVFLVEWLDEVASLVRRYHLYVFPEDGSVEMFDLKTRRTFLKRTAVAGVSAASFFVGAKVKVMGRLLHVVDYADEATRARLGAVRTSTLALVAPAAYEQMGKVMDAALQAGLVLKRATMLRLTRDVVAALAEAKAAGASVEWTAGNSLALELHGEAAVDKWRRIVAGDDAKGGAALRAAGVPAGSLYASPSADAAARDLAAVFGAAAKAPTATLRECAVCVIKPHAVAAGLAGQVVDALLGEGFEVSALRLLTLDGEAAGEFLEVYKTVVPEFRALVEQLSAGACIALELRADDRVVPALRELAGPPDPEVARHIRPHSLRARFGKDKVCNAVHVTDLPEDGPLESEFLFSVMQA